MFVPYKTQAFMCRCGSELQMNSLHCFYASGRARSWFSTELAS